MPRAWTSSCDEVTPILPPSKGILALRHVHTANFMGLPGTVDITVFPARRADDCQRERCRNDNDTERHDREEEAHAIC